MSQPREWRTLRLSPTLLCADLVVYRPKPKAEAAQNLLAKGDKASAKGEAPSAEEVQDSTPDKDAVWWSLFKPNMTIALVSESNLYAANAVPPHVRPCLSCLC